MPSQLQSLTSYLLSCTASEFKIATQSKFLEQAGKGKLKRDILQSWLGMDRLYAQAYVRFAGLLLAGIKLPEVVNSEDVNER